ncbi:MAG TPA: hypothetical protein VI504_00235 [Candidatus Eisenbacteria bacterium]
MQALAIRTTRPASTLRWDVFAMNARRAGTTSVCDHAATHEIAYVIGGVAGQLGSFGKTDGFVSYVFESAFKLYRRELPKPGGAALSELFEVRGALAPRCDERLRCCHPSPKSKKA